MRLVCPNCAAQYEVDAGVLPADGTEVQCSACSTVWFQPGAGGVVQSSQPVKAVRAPRPQPQRPRPEPADEAPPSRPKLPPEPAAPEAAALPEVTPPEPDASATPAAPARSLDPAVAEMLREEAAFEAQQRAKESVPLETQEELGLFGPVGSVADEPGHRGGASRLPDIDDISSTLEPLESGRAGRSGLPQTEAARKRSFLGGLALPVGLAAVLTVLYLVAPMIAQLVPALEGPLGAFVGLVDKARQGVAGLIGLGS